MPRESGPHEHRPRAAEFADRREAGCRLAEALLDLAAERPVVMALPRGGVPVAAEVARALKAPLDLVLVQKIAAPRQPELAVGAIVDGPYPETVLNPDVVTRLRLSEHYIEEATQRALAEIERRRRIYLGTRPHPQMAGRVVILVDDGVATGATLRAAIHAVRRRKPKKIVAAIPVAAQAALAPLRRTADDVRCLISPEELESVGSYYDDFAAVDDRTVTSLLAASRAG